MEPFGSESEPAALLELFCQLKARYHDVLHDMGESEKFLVDGESLLLEAIIESRCPVALSGAPLQLVYYVEKLLDKLEKHGGRFVIVFFSDYRLIWRDVPEVVALRAVLISHLDRVLPEGVVCVLKCWWCLPDARPAAPASAGGLSTSPSNASGHGTTGGPPDQPPSRSPEPTQEPPVEPQLEARPQAGPPASDSRPPPDDPGDMGPRGFERLLLAMRPAFLLSSDLRTQLDALLPAASGQSQARQQEAGEQVSTALSSQEGHQGQQQQEAHEQHDRPPEHQAQPAPSSLFAGTLDPEEHRRRLLASPQVRLAADLSLGLMLRCLHFTSCVLMSSLNLNTPTAPFGFIVTPGGAARLLHLRFRIIERAVAELVLRQLYCQNPAARSLAAGVEDAIAAEALQNMAACRAQGVEAPRASLAAALCRHLLSSDPDAATPPPPAGPVAGGAHASSGGGASNGVTPSSGPGGPNLHWFCEVYMLHALLLDYTPLEHRALALPYGKLLPLYGNNLESTGGATPRVRGPSVHIVSDATATAQLSLRMQSFMARSVLPLMARVVRAEAWGDLVGVIGNPGGTASSGSTGLAPVVAVVDPYQGGMLHALVAVLLVMRGMPTARPAASAVTAAACLGLSPVAVAAWQMVRQLAGFPAVAADTTGESLLGYLVDTMPWSEQGDARAAEILAARLLGLSSSAEGTRHRLVSGDAASGWHVQVHTADSEGLPARLDRRAPAVLLVAAGLPELLRRNPVVQAVERLWPGGPAACGSRMDIGMSVLDGADQRSTAAGGMVSVARLPGAAAAAAAASPPAADREGYCWSSGWGPWAELVRPVLGQRGSAEGGFEEGSVEEVYHWHNRTPLEPAFLTQAEDRESVIGRLRGLLRKNMPPERLVARFYRYLKPRHRHKAAMLALVGPPRELHQLLQDDVDCYLLRQRNMEEASLKRLIDSLQGGITFFRTGGGGGGVGRLLAATAGAAGGSSGSSQPYPLVVASLSEVTSVAHLEAIRRDRSGKDALAELLAKERMSPADLRRKLEKEDGEQAALQRRAAERQSGLLQGEVERWRHAVMSLLEKPGVASTPEAIAAVLQAIQRCCTGPTTPPELRSISVVLRLQLHQAALRRAPKQLDRQGPGNAAADAAAGSANAGAGAREGAFDATGGGRQGAGTPPLGHILPPPPAAGAAGPADGGAPDSALAAGLWAADGVPPAPLREHLTELIQALIDFKTTCRGNRALWIQPCPLLSEPREAAPGLAIVCGALEVLGFRGTSERLLREAGWSSFDELVALAKELDGRRKAIAKQQKEGGGGGSSRSGVGSSSGGKGAVAATAAGGSGGKSGKGKAAAAGKEAGKGAAVTAASGQATGSAGTGSMYGVDALGVDETLLLMYGKITAKDLGIKTSQSAPLGISLVRFQLRCMGDRLERLAMGSPDPRVGFIPDAWQRRLLDVIDTGASAVVSAPTSSGKTFISSYVVRKVLDQHRGHGRVVVVVPTKVLVLQVQAQIAKDFHDVRSLPAGMVMHGTFTRDFRQNTLNSVVLVTVPQCLEILMLSPAHRNWVAAVKYIIFDEVQCINEVGMGPVWERSLLGACCSFLALSATIGNPETFTAWLQRVKQVQRNREEQLRGAGAAAAASAAKGGGAGAGGGSKAAAGAAGANRHQRAEAATDASYEVHLIVHKERYNDLTSSMYLPSLEAVVEPAPRVRDEDEADMPPPQTLLAPAPRGRQKGSSEEQVAGPVQEEELMPHGVETWGVRGAQARAALAAAAASAAAAAGPPLPIPVQRVTGSGAAAAGSSRSASGAAGGGGVGGDAGEAVGGGGGGSDWGREGVILPLHPLTSVDLRAVASTGKLPPELSMTPGEALQLYDGLVWQASVVAKSADRRGDARLSSTVAAVRQRLAVLDPEQLFASVPDPAGTMQDMLKADTGAWQTAPSSAAGGAAGSVTAPGGSEGGGRSSSSSNSLVLRDWAKAWEKVLLREVLLWARATVEMGVGTQGPGAPVGGATPSAARLYGPWRSCLAAIQTRLAADVDTYHKEVAQAWREAQDGASITGNAFLHKHLPSLVLKLHRQQKLPGIVFNFSRHGIQCFGTRIVSHLEAAQERYRQLYAPQLARHLKAYEAAAASRRGGADEEDSDGDSGGPDGGASDGRTPMSRTVLIDGLTFSLDPSRPDPSFSFIPFSHMDDDRLLTTLRDLRLNPRVNSELVRALEFGVGVHHSGLHKHYRQAVEMLFRAKILQVVIATGTLAMGVHMPCRSVVMAGDSSHLDALNFRQMSGRSGRRGLDTLGHVVFFGIAPHRIDQLRTSPMPRLHGQMLVTPSTTLRLLMLDEQLRDKGGASGGGGGGGGGTARSGDGTAVDTPAVDLTLKILMEPFLAATAVEAATVYDVPLHKPPSNTPHPSQRGANNNTAGGRGGRAHSTAAMTTKPSGAAQGPGTAAAAAAAARRRELMRHTLGLSLVHLVRCRMLDPGSGRLQGLAGLATHLFWTEPSNLVFCRLLHDGVLARMCEGLRGGALKDAAVTLLAHVFLRTPLPPNRRRLLQEGAFAGTTSSIVQLRPLHADAEACINQYNSEGLAAAVGHAMGFILQEQARSGQQHTPPLSEATLPLSGLVLTTPAAAAAPASTDASEGPAAAATADTGVSGERIGGAGSSSSGTTDGGADAAVPGSLQWLLGRMRRHLVACSPFMALGGEGDDFSSLSELLLCARQGIELQPNAIPVLELHTRHGAPQPLNAWVYDFYKNHTIVPLVRDNGIREGDVWDMLVSAQSILRATALALELAAEKVANPPPRAGRTPAGAGRSTPAAATAAAAAAADARRELAADLAAQMAGGDEGGRENKDEDGAVEEDDDDDGAAGQQGGDDHRVQDLEARLLRLQEQSPSPRRTAWMVALLVRLVEVEFSRNMRRVAA